MSSERALPVSEILQHLLFERKLTATELARQTGVPQPTIHRMVTGKCALPHRATLEPIAKYFDLSVEQLTGVDILPENSIAQIFPGAPQAFKQLPMMAWEDLDNVAMAEPISDSGVIATNILSEDCFVTSMPDSSMEPMFSKGSILIVDPSKEASDRSFVLAKLADSGLVVFRQLLMNAEHRFLKPINPDLSVFPMRLLDEKDELLGTLVEARQIFDDFA